MRSYYTAVFILLLTISALGQKTILWKIEHPDSEKSSYIVGTYHQIGNSFVDSIPIIEESLLKSDVVIFESIDSKEELIRQMNARECTNEIADLLNQNELQQLKDLSKDWTVDICKLLPAEIYLKLNQELPKYFCNTVQPSDTWEHFDNYLMSIAKANAKELVGLESTTFQLKTLIAKNPNSTKKDEQKRIKKLLKQIAKGKPDSGICAQAEAYMSFRMGYQLDSPCPEGATLKGRNASWMKKLPNLLKESNCFIVVGMGHLMMDCGLIESLKNEGFIVEPILLNKSGS